MKNKLTFSIIIATYNEGDDARISIESALNQTIPPLEIVVIDDSTDNTKEIIKEYSKDGVKLIDGPAKGCCEAVNVGIQTARGDIVVEVDADVALPPDFLEKIKPHYEAGADLVLVEAEVFNKESLYARFVEAQHRLSKCRREKRRSFKDQHYSEGISYRKKSALEVGMYTGDYPLKFCRDWTLGKKMQQKGYNKIVDNSIVVKHKAPDNLKEYWRVRKTRGKYGSLLQYFIFEKSVAYLIFKFIAKDIVQFLKFVLLFPAFVKTATITKYSDLGAKDFFKFLWAYTLQEWARVVGEWEGIRDIVAYKNPHVN